MVGAAVVGLSLAAAAALGLAMLFACLPHGFREGGGGWCMVGVGAGSGTSRWRPSQKCTEMHETKKPRAGSIPQRTTRFSGESHVQTLDHQDITGRINLADPRQVETEVRRLLRRADPGVDEALLSHAFDVFTRLYSGTLPGYHRCETLYHDMQHALDVALAAARLMAGHERAVEEGARFGAERLTLGFIVALFHDSGYIRRRRDQRRWHGAQYTRVHVTRGGRFLTHFLKEAGRPEWVRRAAKLIHFTGYEIPLEEIRLKDPLDRELGHLIGTADLIAQMADRGYLEKCRDYLYEEFELGGLTRARDDKGREKVVYASAYDLLRKTPAFYATAVRKRLDNDFGRAYRHLEALFDGENPYLAAIDRNIGYLQQLLEDGRLNELLRRRPEPVPAP